MSSRSAMMPPRFADWQVFEEYDPQEDAGDEFACLDDHDCISPGGHMFLTSCGETRCVHCCKVAWS